MKTLAYKTVLTLIAALTLVSIAVPNAAASSPKALMLNPDSDYGLPKFGFKSFNIQGVGERVTFVQWGGRAASIGLEPGDIILSVNDFPLSYYGAWNDALAEVLSNGGWMQLAVRDVRTGSVAYRQAFIGGNNGPVSSYYVTDDNCNSSSYGYPSGPTTYKSKYNSNGGKYGNGNYNTLKQLSKLLDKKN